MDTKQIFDEIKKALKASAKYDDESSLMVGGDSLELMRKIPDHSIALILTDPPYHSTKKKNITNDTAFNTDDDYIDWMREYSKECIRLIGDLTENDFSADVSRRNIRSRIAKIFYRR